MRITGGRHRGRRLLAPEGDAVRPTSDFVRQAMFNILRHGALGDVVTDAVVLDAFAGTGALGLEALSRGAAHAIFLERDRAVLDVVRRNVAALGEAAHVTLVAADARTPPPCHQPGGCTLALLDPPYGEAVADALTALNDHGWFAAGALAVVESAQEMSPAAGWRRFDARRYGATVLTFLEAGSDDAPHASTRSE